MTVLKPSYKVAATSIFSEILQPSGNESTENCTYRNFYDFRHQNTQEKDDEFKIAIISRLQDLNILANQEAELEEESLFDETSVSDKSIDIIAYEFCKAKKLLGYLENIYIQIENNFKGLQKVEVNYCVDPEILNYEMIVFSLSIKNDLKDILCNKKVFYNAFQAIVPPQLRSYFVLTYDVV